MTKTLFFDALVSFCKERIRHQVQDVFRTRVTVVFVISGLFVGGESSTRRHSSDPHLTALPFIVSSDFMSFYADVHALLKHTSFYFSSFNCCVTCRAGSEMLVRDKVKVHQSFISKPVQLIKFTTRTNVHNSKLGSLCVCLNEHTSFLPPSISH